MRKIDADELGKTISEWMDQPRYGDYDAGYDDALCAVQDLISDMPTITQQSEWISMKNRLPDIEEEVLIFFDAGNMAVGWRGKIGELLEYWAAYSDSSRVDVCLTVPTHWMPLPPFPKDYPMEGECTDAND